MSLRKEIPVLIISVGSKSKVVEGWLPLLWSKGFCFLIKGSFPSFGCEFFIRISPKISALEAALGLILPIYILRGISPRKESFRRIPFEPLLFK
jgi:hypothetical protein